MLYVIEHRTKKEVVMAKKDFGLQNEYKQKLGVLIKKLRESKNLSLRDCADSIGLPPSNLSYIEKGINVPTAEVYEKIVTVLIPSKKEQESLDKLYSSIRRVPPPDVCNVLLKNPSIYEAFRVLKKTKLNVAQIKKIEELFNAFNSQKENDNDE